MNQEKIDFLATKVMGWRKITITSPSCRNNISFWSRDGKEKTETMDWNPYEKIEEAWGLLEKLNYVQMSKFFHENDVEGFFLMDSKRAAKEITEAVYEIMKEEG